MTLTCCVLGCETSDNGSNPEITFHQFPKKQPFLDKWILATGRKNWFPNKRSQICSLHFAYESFFHRHQRRKLKMNALPLPFDDCPASAKDMTVICKMCLSLDTKMYDLNEFEDFFKEVLQIEVSKSYPRKICYLCVAMLRKSLNFRTRCLRAQKLLEEIQLGDMASKNEDIKIKDWKEEIEKQLKKDKFKTFNLCKTDIDTLSINPETKMDSAQTYDNKRTMNDNGEYGDDYGEGTNNDDDEDRKPVDFMQFFADNKSNGALELNEVAENIQNDIDTLAADLLASDIEVKADEVEVKCDIDEIVFNEHLIENTVKDEVIDAARIDRRYERLKRKKTHKKAVKKSKSFDSGLSPVEAAYDPEVWERIILTEKEIVKAIETKKNVFSKVANVYKCNFCYKDYPNEKLYNAHMLMHDPSRGEHQCPYCKSRFRRGNDLNRHIKFHVYRLKCKQCGGMFTLGSKKKHEKYHQGVKYKCEMCGKVFDQTSSYMNHLRLLHRSAHVCPGCGENFLSARAVLIHYNKMHLDHAWPEPVDESSDLLCKQCGVQFVDGAAFSTHLRTSLEHGEGSNVKAPEAPNEDGCKLSKSSATGEDLARTSYQGLKIKTVCPECGLGLPSQSAYLSHHRAEHPGVAVHGRHMCELCGKKYHSRASLRIHQMSHDVSATFVCDYCHKRCVYKSNLSKHILQAHFNVRRFGCEICGKRFTNKTSSQNHLRHVHQGLPWPKRLRNRPSTHPPLVSAHAQKFTELSVKITESYLETV